MVNSHKVKSRMYELGLTQETVAKDLSMDLSTFNLKLNNNRRFYLDEIARLSKILGVSTQVELREYFGLDFLIVADSCENETKEELGGA